jgi:D-alanyl-D-alanine carboxypeptidase
MQKERPVHLSFPLAKGCLVVALAAVIAGCGADAGPTAATPSSGQLSASPSSAPSTPAAAASIERPAASTPTASPQVLFAKLPTANVDDARATALQAVLDEAVRKGAPDAIAAVITMDGVWAGAAGIGGPDGRTATADDEFAIASVTKMFTAALIMRLSEEGRIDLDAPLASYLGSAGTFANGATVRQALAMRAGLAADSPDAVARIHADAAHAWTTAELVKEFGSPTGMPGTAYLYSNVGYALLAMAAEHVTGQSYGAALRAEVLDPVGARRILEQGPGAAAPKPWALPTLDHSGGYTAKDLGAGGALPCISSATYSMGGASMASDAPSLAAWAWRLFAGEVVAPGSLAQMTTIGPDSYGLGVEGLAGLGQAAYGHTGGKTGYGSILAVFPDLGAVVVLFVNDPDFIVEPFVRQLLEASRAG